MEKQEFEDEAYLSPEIIRWIRNHMTIEVDLEQNKVHFLIENTNMDEFNGTSVIFGIIGEKSGNGGEDTDIRLVRIGGTMRDCFIIGGYMDIELNWKDPEENSPGRLNFNEYFNMIETPIWFEADERRDYRYIFD